MHSQRTRCRWRGCDLATVTRGEFLRDVVVDGVVVAAVSPTLFSPADGNVTFRVQPGDTVKTGDVLATVDSPELTNRLAQERATQQGLGDGPRAARDREEDRGAAQPADGGPRRGRRQSPRSASCVAPKAPHAEHVISDHDYEKAKDDLIKAKLEHEHALENARLQSESLAFELKALQLERDRQDLLVTELARARSTDSPVRSPVDGMVGTRAVAGKRRSRATPRS